MPNSDFIDYYQLLDIKLEATQAEIRMAYKKMALIWHPDRHPPERQLEATRFFQLLNDANAILTDTVKRYDYNLQWRQQKPGPNQKPSQPAPSASTKPAPTNPKPTPAPPKPAPPKAAKPSSSQGGRTFFKAPPPKPTPFTTPTPEAPDASLAKLKLAHDFLSAIHADFQQLFSHKASIAMSTIEQISRPRYLVADGIETTSYQLRFSFWLGHAQIFDPERQEFLIEKLANLLNSHNLSVKGLGAATEMEFRTTSGGSKRTVLHYNCYQISLDMDKVPTQTLQSPAILSQIFRSLESLAKQFFPKPTFSADTHAAPKPDTAKPTSQADQASSPQSAMQAYLQQVLNIFDYEFKPFLATACQRLPETNLATIFGIYLPPELAGINSGCFSFKLQPHHDTSNFISRLQEHLGQFQLKLMKLPTPSFSFFKLSYETTYYVAVGVDCAAFDSAKAIQALKQLQTNLHRLALRQQMPAFTPYTSI